MTFGILGGDRRQRELVQLLRQEGERVMPFSVEGEESASLEEALGADVLILPLPLSDGKGRLNAKGETLSLEELFPRIAGQRNVFAGMVREEELALAAEYGIDLRDYFRCEELTVANAAITADCAMMIAGDLLPHKPRKVLVSGFGRIGKFLCARLQRGGTEVWVAGRKAEDRAWALGFGYHWLDIRHLRDSGERNFDLVFNTVPARLDETYLENLFCPVVDLASVPCMSPEYPFYIASRGLPGRMAPEAAAKAIREAVGHILQND